MGWYRVVKTVKGHRYLYEQRSWREGKKVRTQSRYIGPAVSVGPSIPASSSSLGRGMVEEVLADLTKPVQSQYIPDNVLYAFADPKIPVKRIPEIDKFISGLDVKQTHKPDRTDYSFTQDIVNIPPEREFFAVDHETATQNYYASMFHEIAHWTGHWSRLNRPSEVRDNETYCREELVATATSVLLMRHFNIAPTVLTRRMRYFQDWLSRTKDREQALSFVRREAERTLLYLLNVITTT